MNKNIINDPLWEECAKFHGHVCPGLTIGYKAALYAKELLSINDPSVDEEYVCVSENNACGVDAIQVILSCTAGKGNFFINNVGKSAYTFFNRTNGKSVRIILKDFTNERETTNLDSREKWYEYLHSKKPCELFDIKDVTIELPQKAMCFKNYTCSICGESCGEKWVRIMDGKIVCLSCFNKQEGVVDTIK